MNLGVAVCKAGELQEGIKQFDEARRLDPDNINAYTNMTKAYVLLKRPEEAIASAEKALELAKAQGKTTEAGEITAWLKSYRSQQGGCIVCGAKVPIRSPCKAPLGMAVHARS